MSQINISSMIHDYLVLEDDNIIRLDSNDFLVDTQYPTSLKKEQDFVVCFHGNDKLSKDFLNALVNLKNEGQFYGFLGTVNILLEKKILKGFNKIMSNPNHPHNKFKYNNTPIIIYYLKGIPHVIFETTIDVTKSSYTAIKNEIEKFLNDINDGIFVKNKEYIVLSKAEEDKVQAKPKKLAPPPQHI